MQNTGKILVVLDMAITYVIRIIDAISQSLVSGEQALSFFQEVLSNVIVDTVVIDFSGVVFMSNAFAKQYAICKNQSKTKKDQGDKYVKRY